MRKAENVTALRFGIVQPESKPSRVYMLIDFDGKYLSTEAAQELFIDDTPGHIMNPDDKGSPKTGLFPRDYVFKQFRTKKVDFGGYFDLAKEGVAACTGSKALDESTYNYEFTGGSFPQLIKE